MNCKNSHVGCYECYEEIKAPDWSSHENICMDKCLVDEIKYLWSLGIETNGCCCGRHSDSRVGGYIGVYPKDVEKMKKLGYVVRHNECRPWNEDSFIPKYKVAKY